MSRNRIDRIKSFDVFSQTANDKFESLKNKDKRAIKYDRIYSLNIHPKYQKGSSNNRFLQVNWGNRVYESKFDKNKATIFAEIGAAIVYSRNDDGFVHISINPASTENIRPIESSIFIHKRVDPINLKNDDFIIKNWNYFMSYMECTSLDGNPTMLDKTRVIYLRHFKHMVIGDTWQPIKFYEGLKEILKFTFTVGLSGFLIYLFTFSDDSKQELIENELKAINRNIIELDQSVKALLKEREYKEISNKSLEQIKSNFDKLIMKLDGEQIEDAIEEIKGDVEGIRKIMKQESEEKD